MAAQGSKIIDFQAYRAARLQSASGMQAVSTPCAAFQPVMVMVPVWAFFPMVPGAWIHAG